MFFALPLKSLESKHEASAQINVQAQPGHSLTLRALILCSDFFEQFTSAGRQCRKQRECDKKTGVFSQFDAALAVTGFGKSDVDVQETFLLLCR